MSDWDTLFSQVRRSPFAEDGNAIPQEVSSGNGNIAPTGWLEDGSVTADVIRANAVVAGKVDADAITAREIAANSVTADEIAANTITAAEIAANTITAGQIAANTITAAEIASNAITADEIAANTITAAEIAANTITAAEIAADTITTSELAADSVITENILAGSVTSSRMEVTITGKRFGADDGTAVAPGYFFDSDSDYGLYWAGSGFPIVGAALGISTNGSDALWMNSLVNVSGNELSPAADNTYDLGSTSTRWATVYRVGESAVSDRRMKRDIEDAPLGLGFIKRLKPRIFRWRDVPDTQAAEKATADFDPEAMAVETEPYRQFVQHARARLNELPSNDPEVAALEQGIEECRAAISEIHHRHMDPVREAKHARRPGRRQHYGLIAQEVKQVLDDVGVDAAFWQEDPEGNQSLSYSELMIPLLRAVQELAQRVEELEAER